MFKKASKKQARARIGIIGPAGSGKTYTALKLATHLGGKIAVIDTENGSASKYADEFEFDVCELDNYDPRNYIKAIQAAGNAGYDVLIIDSLSHAWAGEGGALEMADKFKVKYRGNKFAAWGDVTPIQNQLVQTMLSCPMHLIATMRSKMEYIQTKNDKGETEIKKVGMAPIQRDGMEYEFDIVGDMDLDHNFIVSKTRCRALDGAIINKPGDELAKTIKDWLTDGVKVESLPQDHVTKTAENKTNTEKKNGTANFASFWANAKNLGFTEKEVHKIAGVDSLKGFSQTQLNSLLLKLRDIKKKA